MNPLVKLYAYGQSFWYDNIRRQFLRDETIEKLIEKDGLRGITSNPSIFQKAIGNSDDYDEQLQKLVQEGKSATEIYEALVLADIQAACDLFTDLYKTSNGGDGFVSLEVSPHLARDTNGTVEEARRLYHAVNRPNVMIKVPATPAGIPAIQRLIGEGINVNVTLMFSMDHYENVATAYINGIKKLVADGGDPTKVASVASFFVSRVDTAVDNQLQALNNPEAEALLGEVAIANSKVVYQRFKERFHGAEFADLLDQGASRQRLLWASTSTKNENYPDTLYIDSLIGPETVNTIPPATVDAFRDHGTVADTLEADVDEAQATLDKLAELGVSLDEITEKLQDDGVDSFAKAFDELMQAIEDKMAKLTES